MTIRFVCPRGHKLAVPDNLAGKKGRCPICQQRVYIPMLELADAEAEPQAADQPSVEGMREPSAGPPGEPMPGYLPSPESPDARAAFTHPVQAPPLGMGGEGGAETAADANGQAVGDRPGPPPIPAAGRSGDELPPHFELSAPSAPSSWPESQPPPPDDQSAPQELSVIIDEPEEAGYQADPGKVQTTYMLAVALGALTLLCAAPALRHPNLVEAPNWARVVLIASAVQLVFLCWMVSLPDWSTVWINMVVFAFVAALYGVAWAVITFTPEYMPVNFLDLDEPPDAPVRNRAGPWCFVMLMLATLLTYACGRFSGRWRRQYEMAKAMRE